MNFNEELKRIKYKNNHSRNVLIAEIASFILVIAVIFGIRVTFDALDMVGDALQLKTELQGLVSCIKEKDYAGAEAARQNIDVITDGLNSTLDEPMMKMATKIPVAGKYVCSLHDVVDMVDITSHSIIKPAISVLAEYPMSDLKVDDGFNVNVISAYIHLLEDITPQVEELSAKLDGLNIPMGDSGKIAEYMDKFTPILEAYKDAEPYFPLLTSFLGDGDDRTYLLAAQNSAEIRASGGFPGSIGTIQIRDGVLRIGDFESVYNVLSEHTPNGGNVTDQEDELFGFWMNYPRDACYNPDFERVAHIWALAYERNTGEPVDGVVSLTPMIIQDLLGYIGTITLSDGTELNGDNATRVLQNELYFKYLSEGKATPELGDMVDDLFAETAKTTMSMLVSDFSLGRIKDYFNIFLEGAENRTIMMWMADEEEQEYARIAGCSGGLNSDENNPKTGVYFSCSDPSKLGWYLNMDTNISEPTLNDDGTRTYDVTVSLSNAIDNYALRNGGGYILGNYDGAIKGFIHLFAPAGGTVSDFKASNGLHLYRDEYEGLELGYSLGVMVYTDSNITITYKVTTAPGVTTPLGVSSTPTLQKYR